MPSVPVDTPLHGVREVIEEICDQVIEKGRLAFAAKADVNAADVGFEQRGARFFVLDRNQSGSILEMVEVARATPALSPGRVIGIERRRPKITVRRLSSDAALILSCPTYASTIAS